MKKFYNPNTKFDPNYRNIQSELWVYLSDEQRAIIGGIFKHLKNHAQVEIASAMIDYIESDYEDIPSVYAWSDITVGAIFHMILNRAFGVEIEELFPDLERSKVQEFLRSSRCSGEQARSKGSKPTNKKLNF